MSVDLLPKDRFVEIPESILKIGLIKFEILASGIKISQEAQQYVAKAKLPIRTRSGASGGLDIILAHDIFVNCPVNENFARESRLLLDIEDNQLIIKDEQKILCKAELQPSPQYYGEYTTDGVPMVHIGQLCSGDRFCYGMTGPYCRFWRQKNRCKFCSIGLSKGKDSFNKTIEQMLEALSRAIHDPLVPAKHILLGGGTPSSDDMGAILAAKLCNAIKKQFNLSCYTMIAAPLKNKYIDLLFEAQVDELGMNLEFFSDNAWRSFISGKDKYIGKARYLDALEYAVKRFGPIKTRSLLVVGLEEPEFTIAGAEKLASMGVMPILSPFRPLNGTELENARGFNYHTYFEIYWEVHKRAMRYGIPTGPTCIPCQNNTLALPLPGNAYHYY